MKYPVYSTMILCGLLFLISGCSRYVCWAQKTFKQAPELGISVAPARAYLRSEYVYDQFSTVGLFDALWLTNTVRDTAHRIYAARWSMDADMLEEILDNQHTENYNTLSFYLLIAPEENNFVTLSNAQAEWSIVLDVDGTYYLPRTIQEVDLDPQYRLIFGKLYSHFKVPYLITFEAFDDQERAVISTKTQKVRLVLRSVNYTAALVWCLH